MCIRWLLTLHELLRLAIECNMVIILTMCLFSPQAIHVASARVVMGDFARCGAMNKLVCVDVDITAPTVKVSELPQKLLIF